MIQQEQ